jgi:hypothetical protein
LKKGWLNVTDIETLISVNLFRFTLPFLNEHTIKIKVILEHAMKAQRGVAV